jgi:hypothetical protein
MTDDEMREAIKVARRIADPIGPLHGYWDCIFDAEAILAEGSSILWREDVERELAAIVKRHR